MSKKHTLALAMITISAAALAGQQQSPIVLIKYSAAEKSPTVIQEVLTSPIERAVQSLPRVTSLRSTTGNGTTGVDVAVKISFEGGATSLDLEAVLKQVSQLQTKMSAELTSVTVQLAWSHEDDNVDPVQREAGSGKR